LEIDALPVITEEMREEIRTAMMGDGATPVVMRPGVQVTKQDLRSLHGQRWLNDEVITAYMRLIEDRSTLGARLQVHTISSHITSKLVSRGYRSLTSNRRRTDIFNYDLVVFPFHINESHWTVAIVYNRDHSIQYYDSTGGYSVAHMQGVLSYLQGEHLSLRGTTAPGYTCVRRNDIPMQDNNNDCGVFACLFVEFASRAARPRFDSSVIPQYREKIAWEILHGRILQNTLQVEPLPQLEDFVDI
jgi:sentrin-specific protease 1